VEWQPRIPVLDQERFHTQGIDVVDLVAGAENVDALGACTGFAGTAALSILLGEAGCAAAGLDTADPVRAAEYAIRLYAEATREDQWLAEQWPPTDCGSSGLGVARALKARGLISSYVHATSASALCSLLQNGPVMVGMEWREAFFEPDRRGFIDSGDWSRSPTAGGHEVCVTALERVKRTWTGRLDLRRTVVRVRNSWGPGWGDHGEFRCRLSTLYGPELGPSTDAIQLRLVA
jgi:hypothetical protein